MKPEITDDLLIRLMVKTAKIEAMLSALYPQVMVLHTSAGAPLADVMQAFVQRVSDSIVASVRQIASSHPSIAERVAQAAEEELKKI